MTKNRWQKEEDEILISYYGKELVSALKDRIPRHSISSIKQRARKLKLKSNGQLHAKYTVNNIFFQEKSNASIYWAGFIAADGCISKNRKSLRIALSMNDFAHLEQFKKDIEYSGPIAYSINRKTNIKYCYIQINHPDIIRDLENIYKITPRKSLTLQPPNSLSLEESLYFTIGYFDGDGYIGFVKGQKRNSRRGVNTFVFSVVGTQSMMQWFIYIFSKICPQVIPIKITKTRNIFSVRYVSNKAKHLYNKFLEIECPQRLKRKWKYIVESGDLKCIPAYQLRQP